MSKTTSLQRCLGAFENKIYDRVPVIPQGFLFACKTAGYSIGDINKDGKLIAKTHLISQKQLGYDGVVVDVDDASLAEACGAKVLFRKDDVAVVKEEEPLLKNIKDVDKLKLPDPYSSARLPQWLEATRILKKEIGEEVFILGRADQGPFDLACLLRGAQNFLMDLLTEDPKDIHILLDYCRQASTLFAKAQKDCGAHATSIGEAYAGPNLISPKMYRNFAFEHQKKMAQEMKEYGIPFSIHICGDSTEIVGDMVNTGATIIEIDWKVDIGKARQIANNKAVVMGNIDPSDPLVWGTPQKVKEQATNILKSTGGSGVFLSSGCAMGYNTPKENVQAMIEASAEFGNPFA